MVAVLRMDSVPMRTVRAVSHFDTAARIALTSRGVAAAIKHISHSEVIKSALLVRVVHGDTMPSRVRAMSSVVREFVADRGANNRTGNGRTEVTAVATPVVVTRLPEVASAVGTGQVVANDAADNAADQGRCRRVAVAVGVVPALTPRFAHGDGGVHRAYIDDATKSGAVVAVVGVGDRRKTGTRQGEGGQPDAPLGDES